MIDVLSRGGFWWLILDIPCQQFGDKCKLEGFFVPFGHRDGKCIFIEDIPMLDICWQQFGEHVTGVC